MFTKAEAENDARNAQANQINLIGMTWSLNQRRDKRAAHFYKRAGLTNQTSLERIRFKCTAEWINLFKLVTEAKLVVRWGILWGTRKFFEMTISWDWKQESTQGCGQAMTREEWVVVKTEDGDTAFPKLIWVWKNTTFLPAFFIVTERWFRLPGISLVNKIPSNQIING